MNVAIEKHVWRERARLKFLGFMYFQIAQEIDLWLNSSRKAPDEVIFTFDNANHKNLKQLLFICFFSIFKLFSRNQ